MTICSTAYPVRHAAPVFALMMLLIAGCQPTPIGSAGGRIDPYVTTQSDLHASEASIPALMEFADMTAQRLALELADLPEVRDAQYRQVLELGSLVNHTNTPTGDFEQIQRRVRNQLVKSPHIRDNFRIVAGRQRMQREYDRVVGQQEDLLQESTATAGPRIDSPETVYLLQGDFYESNRGSRSQYYFTFQVTNLQTREIVLNEDFDLGRVRP